jgi:hypothetical protein
MAKQNAIQDDNWFPALTAHSGTAGTAETVRVVAGSAGDLFTHIVDQLLPSTYDNFIAGYPDGTTETYTYRLGTSTVGTLTITYTDATKGSIAAGTRS